MPDKTDGQKERRAKALMDPDNYMRYLTTAEDLRWWEQTGRRLARM